jgi:hypothetical protein
MKKSSPCVVYRPDANGNLVEVKTVAAPTEVKIRFGLNFGAWNNETDCFESEEPVSIDEAITTYNRNSSCDVVFWGGEYNPKPLNKAERAYVKSVGLK